MTAEATTKSSTKTARYNSPVDPTNTHTSAQNTHMEEQRWETRAKTQMRKNMETEQSWTPEKKLLQKLEQEG